MAIGEVEKLGCTYKTKRKMAIGEEEKYGREVKRKMAIGEEEKHGCKKQTEKWQ